MAGSAPGDVVTMTPDGYMTITDRTKDLVKSGGEWISTVELENAIIGSSRRCWKPPSSPSPTNAGQSARWLRSCARRTAGTLTAEELLAYLGRARRQILGARDRVIFIDEVPKTSVGKFDKKVLRRMYRRGAVGLNALKWCAIGTQSLGDTDSARIMRLERINVWATGSVLFS
jgi:acyl-CoA synthetase (AMP-forming)/AMP-acid ligase II